MKIALLGYGKMGKEIEQIALDRKHQIVLKIDESNVHLLTTENLKKADVAIEFSTPKTTIGNIYMCFEAAVPVIVGTTGWYEKLKEVERNCTQKKAGLFYTSNFSIGVNIFFKVNAYLAKIMNNYPDYDVSIEEIHHIHKLDSPSGTGITTANQILENISRKNKWIEGISINKNDLSIVSKREKEVPGTHLVSYKSDIDDLELKHIAHNRKGFALGAVLAAEFMQGKQGIYGMNELLQL